MRIIGGRYKGIRLTQFKTTIIRPTPDIVRESIFNIIGIAIESSCFIDIFAGTGSIGLEALSRGAKEVIFIEKDMIAYSILKKNLKRCGIDYDNNIAMQSNIHILRHNINTALQILENKKIKADIIFIDPPYYSELYEPCLDRLGRGALFAEGCMVLVEHFFKKDMKDAYNALIKKRTKRYGDTAIDFYSVGKGDNYFRLKQPRAMAHKGG